MPRIHGLPRSTLMTALGLGLAACSGGVAPAPTPDAGPTAPDAGGVVDAGGPVDAGFVDPVVYVPADLPALATEEACVELEDGERPLGVSPDGHLWLGAEAAEGTALRVFDPWHLDRPLAYTVPARDLEQVRAESATVAAYVSEGQLFLLEDGVRTAFTGPTAMAADTSLCGDLRGEAYVFTRGALYQRDEDQWVEWVGVEDALDADARLLDRDGACAAGEDAVWFATGSLELWALGKDELSRPAALEGASQPNLLGTRPLALREGRLFVGPGEWREHAFDAGHAVTLAAAGDAAWIRLEGGQLLRFDGEGFEAAGLVPDDATLRPFAAGGLWLTGGGRACHRAPQGTLRTAGAAHGSHTFGGRALVRAWTREGGEVTAELDGAPLSGRPSPTGTVFEVDLRLGWHAVVLSAGDVTRTVHLEREPTVQRSFSVDVQPIFQMHCSGCHMPDNQFGAPDLSTFEAWRDRANRIRERVIEAGDMPPSATRSPDWGEDEVTVIDEWLSGGRNP